jgi:hypothetical protein
MMSDPRCYAPVKQASYVAGHNETSNMPLPRRAASGITSRDKVLNRDVLFIRVPEKNNSTSCLSFGPSTALQPPTRISICAAGCAL